MNPSERLPSAFCPSNMLRKRRGPGILESWRDNRFLFWLWALPGTFWITVFFIVPLSLLWVYSFGEKSGITDIVISWTTANYTRVFEPVYLTIMWKSFWISVVSTLICLVLAYPIAFAICFAPDKWKPVLLLITILPFWINLLIRTYALLAVFRTNGFVNQALGGVWNTADGVITGGAYPYQPLELLYNNGAVIAGLVYVYLPFMVLPLYATVERLDKSYLEASLDLGASQVQNAVLGHHPAHHAGHHLRHHSGVHPVPRRIPDAGTAGRRQRHHDRQCDRRPVQGGERYAVRRRSQLHPDLHHLRNPGAALAAHAAQQGRGGVTMALFNRTPQGPLEYGRRLWIKILLTATFLFLYAPIIVLIAFSFNDSKRNITWQGFTFKYYEVAWNNADLIEAFTNSLIIAFISTIFATVIGAMVGLLLWRFTLPGQDRLRRLHGAAHRHSGNHHGRGADGFLLPDRLDDGGCAVAVQSRADRRRAYRLLFPVRRRRGALAGLSASTSSWKKPRAIWAPASGRPSGTCCSRS